LEKRIGTRQAKSRLTDWIERVRVRTLRGFNTFLTTLEKWMDETANYFYARQTSGFVEEFNNKIKVIKRRCYGILNVKHVFQRI
jgi:transposase